MSWLQIRGCKISSWTCILLIFMHFQHIKICFFGVKQLLNGSQHKVPAYLGGISVCVCLVAAVVSLGLGLLIVPRQVMPWTGLLLMYEWTFTMFIISFGGYLHLVYQWGKFVASRAAASLSHPESLDYDSGKRMLSRLKLTLWFCLSFNFDLDILFSYIFIFFSKLILYCIYRPSATDVIV